MKNVIALAFVILVAVGLTIGSTTKPSTTRTTSIGMTVEREGTRLTLLGVSSGIMFGDEKDSRNPGDRKRNFVKAVFLKEGKGGVVGEFKINGERRMTMQPLMGTESKSIQVDHARLHWPAAGRMETIPEHAKDTDVILEETNFGVTRLPVQFDLSLDIGGRTFEFADVSP